MVYEAAEDSFLMIECLPDDLKGQTVLEIGCGSGVISIAAAQQGARVTAVDIDPKAVEATKKLAEEQGVTIQVIPSDMFSEISEYYNLIISNPPYLPNEENDPDLALDGGVEGWEWIEKFLPEAKKYLTEEGKILLLFSTRTNEEKVRSLIEENNFATIDLARQSVGLCEELIVVELTAL